MLEDLQNMIDRDIIRDEKLKEIIRSCFKDETEIESFVASCLKKDQTRWMLNRLRWLVDLADHQQYDSVRLFFLIAITEVLIKLSEERFADNDSEVADVKSFFERISPEDKGRLQSCFLKTDDMFRQDKLDYPVVVDLLLNVRHRLAHGKSHYDFMFHSGQENLWNPIWGEAGSKKSKTVVNYELTLTYSEFREIIIKNSVLLIKGYL